MRTRSSTLGVDVGPRKRLLPLSGAEGDVLHVQRTGENMIVMRVDQRGALVRRARGTARAQAIFGGDEIVRVCNLDDIVKVPR